MSDFPAGCVSARAQQAYDDHCEEDLRQEAAQALRAKELAAKAMERDEAEAHCLASMAEWICHMELAKELASMQTVHPGQLGKWLRDLAAELEAHG